MGRLTSGALGLYALHTYEPRRGERRAADRSPSRGRDVSTQLSHRLQGVASPMYYVILSLILIAIIIVYVVYKKKFEE